MRVEDVPIQVVQKLEAGRHGAVRRLDVSLFPKEVASSSECDQPPFGIRRTYANRRRDDRGRIRFGEQAGGLEQATFVDVEPRNLQLDRAGDVIGDLSQRRLEAAVNPPLPILLDKYASMDQLVPDVDEWERLMRTKLFVDSRGTRLPII